MDSPRNDPSEAGYATAAATIMSLALAITASAATAFSLVQVRAARSDLERTQAIAQLDGGQVLAAVTVAQNIQSERLRWRETTAEGDFDILAEPEASKVNVSRVAGGDLGSVQQLDVTDSGALSSRLKTQLAASEPDMLVEADKAPLWRACAPSLLSYFGAANSAHLKSAEEPHSFIGARHAGEVWRIRVSSKGWTDDRIVRITGNGSLPGIAIQRQLQKGETQGEPCAALIQP